MRDRRTSSHDLTRSKNRLGSSAHPPKKGEDLSSVSLEDFLDGGDWRGGRPTAATSTLYMQGIL